MQQHGLPFPADLQRFSASKHSALKAAATTRFIAEAVLTDESIVSASAATAGPSTGSPNEAKRGSLQCAAELEDLCLQMRTADVREGASSSTEEPMCRLLKDHSEAGFRAAMEMLVKQSMEHGLTREFWTTHWTLHMRRFLEQFRCAYM